jgi:hypothetical protein
VSRASRGTAIPSASLGQALAVFHELEAHATLWRGRLADDSKAKRPQYEVCEPPFLQANILFAMVCFFPPVFRIFERKWRIRKNFQIFLIFVLKSLFMPNTFAYIQIRRFLTWQHQKKKRKADERKLKQS